MAFYAAGLPSISAAASDVWPSLANFMVLSLRPRNSSVPKPSPARTATPTLKPSPIVETSPKSTKVALPDFLQTASLAPALRPLVSDSITASPFSIHKAISTLPRSALATANSINRRPFFHASPKFSTVALSAFRPHRTTQPFTKIAGPQQRTFATNYGISRAMLANREEAANRNPSSPTAQNAFYQALLKANMPAIVVERYQSGRYARNEAAEQAYRKAIAMLDPGGMKSTEINEIQAADLDSSGLSAAQRQAVAQAIAARSRGGTVATSKVQGTGTKEGPLHVVVDEPVSSIVFRWFKFLAIFIFFVYLSMVVMTMLVEGMNIFKRPGGRTADSETKAENQTTRFSDVHGCDEAKDELQELVEFLKSPDKFSTLGGKLPKGVLLVGPPGTGKTLLARAVAGEAGVPFFYMSGSEFDEIYVGVGAKRVRDLFSAAKAKSPSIVFIDELDAIGGKRNARDAAYVKQTLNQLLTELDGFEQNSGVVIIAATNFPELLDKALTRPGRFDRHVSVDLPDVRGRIAILKHHAKKVKAASDVNFDTIAARTTGLSGAELENIVNQAAVRASRSKAKSVTKNDFEWAMDKVIMGAEKKTMVISELEKEMTAYHEAGHALVLYFKENGPKTLYKVTVLPRGRSLGHTAYLPEMDKYSETSMDLMSMIEVCMGGKVAEEIVYGAEKVTTGVSADLERATRTAFAMVANFGMSQKLGPMEYGRMYDKLSSETRARVEEEVQRMLNDGHENVRLLLLAKRKELDLLAKALVEYETLDAKEVETVIRGGSLPDRIKVPRGPITVPIGRKDPETPEPPGIPGAPPLGESGTTPTPPPPPHPPATA